MATYTDVFKRKEVKYRLSASQYAAMRAALEGRMLPDTYGLSQVTSLYYDTPERLLIERSLDKPLYKEKLRARWYGAPEVMDDPMRATDSVFVELKKKFKGIVYKRRVACSRAAARAYLAGQLSFEEACERFPMADTGQQAATAKPKSRQIAREIDAFMKRHEPLLPSMLISCDRVAYAPVEPPAQDAATQAAWTPALESAGQDATTSASVRAFATAELAPAPASATPAPSSDVRITFDSNLTYCDLFAPEGQRTTHPIIGEGEAIMEIKVAGPYPLWLVEALEACGARPQSFSKYGEAYRLINEGRRAAWLARQGKEERCA